MRKLASIQKVIGTFPINGADRIERVDILGWECVSKKGDFSAGDLVVYFETDSHLSPHDAYNDFMAHSKMRVKTRKFKKQISQGLVLAISDFPELSEKDWKEGDDVTDILKVEKWKPKRANPKTPRVSNNKHKSWLRRWFLKFDWYRKLEVLITGKTGRNFPTWLVPKTDETRIQAAPGLLVKALAYEKAGGGLYKTEKLEGTSSTYILEQLTGWKKLVSLLTKGKPYKFYICSRNVQKSEIVIPKKYRKFNNDGNVFKHDQNCYVKMAKQYNIEQNLIALSKNLGLGSLAVQGEIIGENVQGNYYGLKGQRFFVFNIYDVDEGKYYDYDLLVAFCANLGLPMVPVCDADYSVENKSVKDVVAEADEPSVINNKLIREGDVIRSKKGKLVSFKAISRTYDLKKRDVAVEDFEDEE